MNYFEHHIGDYAAATAHLTWDEDMAYTRLLRAYYHAEKPIAEGQQYRMARATTPAQRKAVDVVLAEFFKLVGDEHTQKRADEELARFRVGEPERAVKKANEDLRLARHREERASLFQTLHELGEHASWNLPIKDLRSLVERARNGQPATPAPPPATAPATAPATPATATQTPDTRHQSPDKDKDKDQTHPPPVATPTAAGRVCLSMRRIGISIAPGNPDLLALIAAGATEAEFEQAGEVAHRMGKNGAYALGVLKRQRTEAAEAVKAMHKGPMPSVETPRERAARERAEEISPMAARKRPPPPTAEVIDVTSRRLA